MSSQSAPIPAQAFRQAPAKALSHALPLRAVFIAFIAIVILFRWLHLIVSLQVASTDRKIQIGTDDLARIERENAALLYSIAEAMSPRSLAERADEMGYGPHPPAYVESDQPLLPAGEEFSAAPLAEQALSNLVTPAAVRPADVP